MADDQGDKLLALRAKFIATMGTRADALSRLLEGPDDFNRQEAIQEIVHKIAGAAGFYGEQGIAEAAAKIDQPLKLALERGESLNKDAELQDLIRLIGKL
ncbi:MAG: Hpt domain-containing protein [Pseudomonadota bacterium]